MFFFPSWDNKIPSDFGWTECLWVERFANTVCRCLFFSYVLPPLFLLEWVALICRWWGKSCILTIQSFKNDPNHWQQANNLILLKSGYPRLIGSVFLDQHCSSYKKDHSTGTIMGHSMMSRLLGECAFYLTWGMREH
jgi:hypothetical protein